MKKLFFSKSLIEIVDREMPAEPINSRPSLMPLTDKYLNFAKSLIYSELAISLNLVKLPLLFQPL